LPPARQDLEAETPQSREDVAPAQARPHRARVPRIEAEAGGESCGRRRGELRSSEGMLLRSASSPLLNPPLLSSSCRRSPPPTAESAGMDLDAAVGRKEAALSAAGDDDAQAVRRTCRHPRPGVWRRDGPAPRPVALRRRRPGGGQARPLPPPAMSSSTVSWLRHGAVPAYSTVP
jgi:hypothetical protein